MLHGTFPLAKFSFLILKQITKPIHKRIVVQAQRNYALRKYLCIPLAKCFHTCDVRIRYINHTWAKIGKVKLMDEKTAIVTGAHIIAELVAVSALFLILFIEYNKYTSTELENDDKVNKEKIAVNEKLQNIEHALEKQSKQLDELLKYFLQLRCCISRHN